MSEARPRSTRRGVTEPPPPAAIVVRVVEGQSADLLRTMFERWPANPRPVLVGLVSTHEEITEAERLRCKVVLREPQQVRGLYDTLAGVAWARRR